MHDGRSAISSKYIVPGCLRHKQGTQGSFLGRGGVGSE